MCRQVLQELEACWSALLTLPEPKASADSGEAAQQAPSQLLCCLLPAAFAFNRLACSAMQAPAELPILLQPEGAAASQAEAQQGVVQSARRVVDSLISKLSEADSWSCLLSCSSGE